jgi:hypothetical protein
MKHLRIIFAFTLALQGFACIAPPAQARCTTRDAQVGPKPVATPAPAPKPIPKPQPPGAC